jgi:hypothetical protein
LKASAKVSLAHFEALEEAEKARLRVEAELVAQKLAGARPGVPQDFA